LELVLGGVLQADAEVALCPNVSCSCYLSAAAAKRRCKTLTEDRNFFMSSSDQCIGSV